MEKKKLYMIGNSHIDPVWFWNWDEGMQEVKATFASALDRMKEYKEFKFTATSAAFFEWIEKTVPSMFEEIRQRVAEGRWELTGGWFIEPDCHLPSGESFVRQGLYSQRYFKEKFGKICDIGSNVDSFGHGPNLPQLLKKSGMNHYVMMRPRLETPVFVWESKDGSRVNAISLPGEYTTWFHEPTKENIDVTLKAMKDYDKMPCCYGVGNHGGGPTKENIESIMKLREEYPEAELEFSSFTEFFKDIDGSKLETKKQPFEKVNAGCYVMDSELKKLNRLGETRLTQSDMLLSMAAAKTGTWLQEVDKMKELWKTLLFNQFHDTLGGTAIREARDEAIMQLATVSASCGGIKALAIQSLVNNLDTTGEGFPLFLFNNGGQSFNGHVNVELNWFCQDSLKLLNPDGNEIPYQRVHTKAKVRNTVLGGRRNIVFYAEIPPCGYAVYRLLVEQPTMCYNNNMELDQNNPYCLENEFIKVSFDQSSGLLSSLIDKEAGYDAIKAPVSYQVWMDQRDTWGHIQGERPYVYTNENMKLKSIEVVESGKIRQCVRAIYAHEGSNLEQLYYLYAGEKEVVVENRLYWDKNWHTFMLGLPLGGEAKTTKAEGSYTTIDRTIKDKDEYYMHRFLDVSRDGKEGLAISNDCKYLFSMNDGTLLITAARSSMYAQGSGKVEWYNPLESYEYTDIGKLQFTFVLRPHGKELPVPELYRMAKRVNGQYDYLFDSCHSGKERETTFSLASTNQPGVEIMTIKKAEDDNDYIVRILETEGKNQKFELKLYHNSFPLEIGHDEIKTLKINIRNKAIKEVDLLEFED